MCARDDKMCARDDKMCARDDKMCARDDKMCARDDKMCARDDTRCARVVMCRQVCMAHVEADADCAQNGPRGHAYTGGVSWASCPSLASLLASTHAAGRTGATSSQWQTTLVMILVYMCFVFLCIYDYM
jgi:hypothetical protein